MSEEKVTLLGHQKEELKSFLSTVSGPKFLVNQVWDWLYQKNVSQFSQMSNVSQSIREALDQRFRIHPFSHVNEFKSKDGLATKYVFTLLDRQQIEAVVLKEKNYSTLCVSSQCGCPVDCKFCLTGVMGFKRQLTTQEIIAQLHYCRSQGHHITHVVFMGMGEPLLNYDQVIPAIHWMHQEDAFGMSMRKITVSTSGYLQSIQRLIDDNIHLNLAFSVGHPNPEKRSIIMPVEERNPIIQVAQLLKQYLGLHNRKLTLEYTLLKSFNDSRQASIELANLAKFLDAKINLINLNPHPKIPYLPVSKRDLNLFKKTIDSFGVPVTIRFTKGQDIAAACGQLGLV